MEVLFLDESVEEFLKAVEPATRAKVSRTVDNLKRFGYTLGMPHSKKIDTRLFELRIRGIQEVRIIYTFFDNTAVLLHAFIKKSEKIPLRDLRLAQDRLKQLD